MTEAWTRWEGQFIDGKFPLRKCLGGGTSGAVFLTEYKEPALRKAAIKLVPAAADSSDLISRWEAASKLSHPHLLRLFEFGRWKLGNMDLLYVVMEYADENLAQILPQRSLAPQETEDMVGSVLDALSFLHQNGMAHGSVKPSNILAADDQLKLSSDTIASVAQPSSVDESPQVRQPNAYDPPAGAGRSPSAASDIWSLGMTLIQAMTQTLPHPESALQLSRTLPRPFNEIVERCFERDPQKRWSATQVQARLRKVGSAETPSTSQALPAMKSAAAPQQRRGMPGYLLPVAAAGVLLTIVLIRPGLFQHQPPAVQGATAVEPETASQPPVSSPQASTPRSAPSPPASNEIAPTAKSKPAPTRIAEAKPEKLPPAPKPVAASAPVAPTAVPSKPRPARVGTVVKQVLPNVPPGARATVRGTVRVDVKVNVDPEGNVAGAELGSEGPSKYFARLALEAAHDWKFAPPTAEGESLASQWLLRFNFTSSGTDAFSRQTSPAPSGSE